MEYKRIIGKTEDILPFIRCSRYVGAFRSDQNRANTVGVLDNELVYYYLNYKTIKKLEAENKVLDREDMYSLNALINIGLDKDTVVKAIIDALVE